MGKDMRSIGIMPHVQKQNTLHMADELARWLSEKGREVRLLSEDARAMGCPQRGLSQEDFSRHLDLVISLGGDGAMLRAAAIAYQAEAPVVGINMGGKGFLTAVDIARIYPGLEEILAGHYLLQERMMLECILGEGDEVEHHYALNEVAVGKRELRRMIRLEVDINGRYFHFYSGDGVIFSTPTGSTAYSLSAGGPIVEPGLDCIILTPICSHSLMDRSVIISPQSVVQVKVLREKVLPSLSFDGREEIELPYGGDLVIKVGDRRLKMIKMENYSFFNLLRDKFDFPQDNK